MSQTDQRVRLIRFEGDARGTRVLGEAATAAARDPASAPDWRMESRVFGMRGRSPRRAGDLLDDALACERSSCRTLPVTPSTFSLPSYFFGSGGNISIIFGPRVASKLRMLSCSFSGPVNTGL